MVRIFVIDNGGQWTHREWRTLRDLEVQTKIVPNTTIFEDLQKEKIQGLVLSGGAPRIGLDGSLGNCAEYLEKADFPILGICAGHQFMARFFGGEVKPSKIPEFGQVEMTLIKDDDALFEGVLKKSIVWESHNDEVTVLPKDFVRIAESENCKIQAMQHKKKQFYGLQFHPEVEHTEYGEHIFKNFIQLCEE
ncbi:MAG: GMP synthase subunit A [Thermoplasmata archaeon]|nr:GMP synthase subunit A [Thermoplasmata archaeon]MBE3137846.1 GMP synthase subunit A [Thermoplasmata archaeon]MBE3139120.1 GMP synthase subunit A [Thermoplasmata archaeon]